MTELQMKFDSVQASKMDIEEKSRKEIKELKHEIAGTCAAS